MTHTPTPWATGGNASGSCVILDVDSGNRIASTYNADKQPGIANAAFIVRACNAHDELVAALRLAGPALSHALAGLDSDDSDTTSIEQAREAVRAALAKVQV